ncbi:2-dehydro-3-deoxy-6-phosphogalactonate aldolase [Brucella pseudogrignonensis]|uniref:2-dehydro-3-deoxyphosphogalactonate aldolase n=1 Tax=Brucella pseudogrignonensis TaxID=419475 RepID=A0ABU1MEL1_9HYPH|nr:2-dehydro-3-deoxy-6-phosphogalactonate aldolase [Brucella pseudogrignonensis]MDR6434488.1 2-dehydro-3-deoxyphosphogalactonate aldolase [Brucella pseudogrignonensis]
MSQPSVKWPAFKRSLVAILRGVGPSEVEAIGEVLIGSGFEAIEVPLNSPNALSSIECLSKRFGADILIGAGTVLTADDCARVADVGGRLMVSPNIDADVMRIAQARSMVTLPGVFSPTEALKAIQLGASALKFFPASVLGPSGISALSAVLPKNMVIGAVGGVSHQNFRDYIAVGIRTFGLGSSLYRPGQSTKIVAANAIEAVTAYDEAISKASSGV